MNWISVRFYETDYILKYNNGFLIFFSIEYSKEKKYSRVSLISYVPLLSLLL